jgi:hypothetical protein
VSLDLDLFCKYHISDLFPAPTNVGPSSKHEFITDDSQSKVVNRICMILATHYFLSHIAWSARGVGAIFCPVHFGNSHVSNANITIFFHDDVFRFDISVDHSLVMHILESQDHASDHELCLGFVKLSTFANVIPEVSTS